MSKRTLLQNILVGNAIIKSKKDFKQALLRGQLALLIGVVCGLYLILDPINGIYGYIIWYIIGLLISCFVIILNRNNKGFYSTLVLIIFVNIFVFLVADSGSPDRGVFFFFMASSAAGLVLFYNSNISIGLGFAALSIVLGVVANYNENTLLLPVKNVASEQTQQVMFTINFVLGIFSTILVLFFVIKRNKDSEFSLEKSRARLEKLADELLIKNAELEKTNEELDRFVYSASHDMRAPLATLQGLINVAQLSESSDDYPKYFNLMTRRIKDMEGFIKEVTNYSRNARLKVEHEAIQIEPLVDELRKSFSFLAQQANITLDFNIADDLIINSDARRVKVVLNNLIANAIKYSDELKLGKFIKITAHKMNNLCEIIIEDNGIGIDPKYHSKIYDMFYRASESSSGSGLGLYIVKETLQMLEGSIDFLSVLNQGTTFKVKIPVNDPN